MEDHSQPAERKNWNRVGDGIFAEILQEAWVDPIGCRQTGDCYEHLHGPQLDRDAGGSRTEWTFRFVGHVERSVDGQRRECYHARKNGEPIQNSGGIGDREVGPQRFEEISVGTEGNPTYYIAE